MRRARAGGALLITFLGAVNSGAPEAQEASTPPFRRVVLETPAGPSTGMPHLAAGADGRLYLSWVELRAKEAGTLRFSLLEETGWSTPRTIAEGESWFLNWADFPSLQALADGTLVAHWLERLGEGTYAYGVRIALSADAGATWTPPRFLHEDLSAAEHGFASIVPLDRTTFVAVWLDGRATGGHGEDTGAMQLYSRTIARDESGGIELGPEVMLDERVCDCCPTTLVRLPGGGLLAAYRDRTATEIRDISLVRRDPGGPQGGGGWGSPRPLSEDGWVIPGCPVNGPRLVLDPGTDRLAAAWYTGAGGGAGRVLLSLGSARELGPPRSADEGAPEGRVDAVFCRGELILGWLEHEEGRAAWRLRAFPPDGPPTEAFTLAEVPAGRASGHLRLAADGDDLIVAWTDPETSKVETARLEPVVQD